MTELQHYVKFPNELEESLMVHLFRNSNAGPVFGPFVGVAILASLVRMTKKDKSEHIVIVNEKFYYAGVYYTGISISVVAEDSWGIYERSKAIMPQDVETDFVRYQQWLEEEERALCPTKEQAQATSP